MEYLRLNKFLKVDRLAIHYVRKVRQVEALRLDGDGAIVEPVNPNAAVIVLRDRKAPRIITPISFETLMGRMAIVDVGENRFVPAVNIEQIRRSPQEYEAERYTEVWLHGRPWGTMMASKLPRHVLEERLDQALRVQDVLEAEAAAKMAEKMAGLGRSKTSRSPARERALVMAA